MLKNHEAAESPFMLPWVTSVSTSPRIHNFIYKKILPAQGSVLVLCTKFNVQIGAGRVILKDVNIVQLVQRDLLMQD